MTVRVRDAMTRSPITIDGEVPIATAIAVMRKEEIRHLPVMDEAEHLVGIVTDRDLRCAAFSPALVEHLSLSAQRRLRGLGQSLEGLRVRDVMTWDVVTTHPDATLSHAALRMLEGRFGSLPVIEDGRLVGILTAQDLVKTVVRDSPHLALETEAFLW